MEPSIIVKILLFSDIDDEFDKIWNENDQQQETRSLIYNLAIDQFQIYRSNIAITIGTTNESCNDVIVCHNKYSIDSFIINTSTKIQYAHKGEEQPE